MSMNSDYSLSDIAAASGNRQNDGLFGGNGAIWLIVLFLFVFSNRTTLTPPLSSSPLLFKGRFWANSPLGCIFLTFQV